MPANAAAPSEKEMETRPCPKCGDASFRIPRTAMSKIYVGGKRYQCGKCQAKYLWWIGLSIPDSSRDVYRRQLNLILFPVVILLGVAVLYFFLPR